MHCLQTWPFHSYIGWRITLWYSYAFVFAVLCFFFCLFLSKYFFYKSKLLFFFGTVWGWWEFCSGESIVKNSWKSNILCLHAVSQTSVAESFDNLFLKTNASIFTTHSSFNQIVFNDNKTSFRYFIENELRVISQKSSKRKSFGNQ